MEKKKYNITINGISLKDSYELFIKKINHDKTIGLIICREDNKYIIEYATDKRIIARRYEIK